MAKKFRGVLKKNPLYRTLKQDTSWWQRLPTSAFSCTFVLRAIGGYAVVQTWSPSVPMHFMCINMRNCLLSYSTWCSTSKLGNLLWLMSPIYRPYLHYTHYAEKVLHTKEKSQNTHCVPLFHLFSLLSPGTFLSLSGLSRANHWVECPSN